jgi:hypothetical protein
MKKLILVAFTFLSFFVGNAQGNLQFNAVKYFPMTVTQVGSAVYTESAQTITVPVGKVWKIESCGANFYNATTNGSVISTYAKIILDNKVLFETYSGSGSAFIPAMLPLWLPSGTYTLALRSNYLVNGTLFYGFASAIEFNVVP